MGHEVMLTLDCTSNKINEHTDCYAMTDRHTVNLSFHGVLEEDDEDDLELVYDDMYELDLVVQQNQQDDEDDLEPVYEDDEDDLEPVYEDMYELNVVAQQNQQENVVTASVEKILNSIRWLCCITVIMIIVAVLALFTAIVTMALLRKPPANGTTADITSNNVPSTNSESVNECFSLEIWNTEDFRYIRNGRNCRSTTPYI